MKSPITRLVIVIDEQTYNTLSYEIIKKAAVIVVTYSVPGLPSHYNVVKNIGGAFGGAFGWIDKPAMLNLISHEAK